MFKTRQILNETFLLILADETILESKMIRKIRMSISQDSKALIVLLINQKTTFSNSFSKNLKWKSQNFQQSQESNLKWLMNRTKLFLIQRLFVSHERLRRTHSKLWRWKEYLCSFSVTFSRKSKTNKLLINDSISDNLVVKWVLNKSGFVNKGFMLSGSRLLISSSRSVSLNFWSCLKNMILN